MARSLGFDRHSKNRHCWNLLLRTPQKCTVIPMSRHEPPHTPSAERKLESLAGIQVFARVVESASFSAAARILGVAPSSVSRQISELEHALNAQLFTRTTRQISLTEAGQIYYERALRILEEVETSRSELAHLGDPTGVLRVTLPSGFSRQLLASTLPAFLAAYPGIKVLLSVTDQIVNLVEGGLDVALRVGQPADSTYKATRIGESRRVVCASPSYLRRHGEPATPDELARHNCLTWRDSPGFNVWRFTTPDGVVGVKATGNLFGSSADTLIAGAAAGVGIALLPEWNLRSELDSGHLRTILDEYEAVPARSSFYALHAHSRHVPPKLRVFLDFLKTQFAPAVPDSSPSAATSRTN
ncbi:MAG: LysR family transcriptional regulator [Pseudomonadales bacterium]